MTSDTGSNLESPLENRGKRNENIDGFSMAIGDVVSGIVALWRAFFGVNLGHCEGRECCGNENRT